MVELDLKKLLLVLSDRSRYPLWLNVLTAMGVDQKTVTLRRAVRAAVAVKLGFNAHLCHAADLPALRRTRQIIPESSARSFAMVLGVLRIAKTLSVKIPAGVDNGDRIRLSGEGEQGPDGVPPGDQIRRKCVCREHPIFSSVMVMICTVKCRCRIGQAAPRATL